MLGGFFRIGIRREKHRHNPQFRPLLEALEDRTLLSFLAPLNNNFTGSPTGIATGDFTGNHIVDVAVVNPDGNSVLVFLGIGDGTFQAPRSIAVGPDAHALAAADLAHTGRADLVVTHFNEGDPRNTVSVLLSNGDGTFQPPVDYQVGDNPSGIAIGDFTGSGVPDIVVTNLGFFFHDQFQPGTTVSVLLGAGDGTFGPARTFDTGVTPEAVAVGDFTNNGRLSIVTADEGFGNIPGDVAFLPGNGDGTFEPAKLLDLGTGDSVAARSVAAADLTGTGKLDIVAATDFNIDGGVSVILGNGNGTFQNAVTYRAFAGSGSLPIHVAIGDFHGNGSRDIAVESFLGDAAGLDVLPNNGDGTFQSPIEVSTAALGVMAVGDFTGDNSADLAVATTDVLSIFLRQPGGLFKTPTVLATGPGTSSLQTADLRHDNTADLIIANAQNNTVGVMLGNGDGTFQALATYPVGRNPQNVASADLLNNGILDLVVVSEDDRILNMLIGNGDGSFHPAQTITLNVPSNYVPVRVVAGDFEQNGRVDLVVLARDTNNQGSGLITLHGNGDGTFTQDPIRVIAPQLVHDPGRITFEAADLNNDGNLDLVISTGSAPSVAIFFGIGDGTFGQAQGLVFGSSSDDVVASVALADLRGNGILDMVVGVDNLFRTDDVIVRLGNGDGTFQPAIRFRTAGPVTSVVAADFNGDGVRDVAVSEWPVLGGGGSSNSLSVLLGMGDGTFGPPTN
jgi:hypothetical protein